MKTDGIYRNVQLDGSSFQYDSGSLPAVAVSGPTIVEVHEGGSGTLWYHMGGVQSDGTVVFASSAFQYDDGYSPRVAVAGPTILDVHQSGTGSGPLYYHTGAY